MNKNKILSGGEKNLTGGGKWGERGREVGGEGEGSGDWVLHVHPLKVAKHVLINMWVNKLGASVMYMRVSMGGGGGLVFTIH